MLKYSKFALVAGALLAIAPAFAQPKPPKMAKKPPVAMVKVTGMVSGAVSGKMFKLGVPRMGTLEVDASKATVKMNGRFFSLNSLKGGSSVTVEGTKTGMKLMAKSVDVNHVPGMVKPVKKPGTNN